MTHSARPRALAIALILLLLSAGLGPVPAQEMPPQTVRYTEAREVPVRRTIELPGSVEARYLSEVASEVSGRVEALLGREGKTFTRGEPVVRLNADQLEITRRAYVAQLKEAEARLELAERTLQRSRELFDDDVLPRQNLDNAVSEFHAWQGRVEQFTAQLASVDLDLERSTIRAPFAGTVVAEHVELGEWVAAGSAVLSLLSLADLEVRVEVPERYYSSLDAKARPTVTFASLPGLRLEGIVVAIIPRADPQARTFPVKVAIPNDEGRIGVGMLATVLIPAGDSYRATVVPKDAVITQGEKRFVYRINGENIVEMMSVTPGDGVGDWIVVRGDVAPGHKVVTRGNERLFPGAAVQGQPQGYALP